MSVQNNEGATGSGNTSQRRFSCRHILIAAFLLLSAGYAVWYWQLRSSHRLIHRFTTGYGNQVVWGDFNPGFSLLDPDPDRAVSRYRRGIEITLVLSWPARCLESWWHDATYTPPAHLH